LWPQAYLARYPRPRGSPGPGHDQIGFPMPLSGPAAVYGVPILKGAEMAVEETNAKGEVPGKKLELLSRDSKATRTKRCASPAS
jgi:ABC-type branched-subunit amino acid transport system substrate-binding protein